MTNKIKQVVVIDDSMTTLLLIKNLLYDIDNSLYVKLFDKPEQGLKYLNAHTPDLLIIDLYMPRYSGLEILKKIHVVREMKVFMVSANTKVIKIESALELGIDEYFTKPLKINRLKIKIIKALNIKEKYHV